jgi:hypothetical protein
MSSLRSKFKTSSNLENEGVWYEVGNTRIRLARAGGSNLAYNNAMLKFSKENARAMATASIDETKMLNFLMEVYAEYVVTDWETETETKTWIKGIEGADGGILEVNFDNILATFKELQDLFLECKLVAEGIQYFRQSLLDDAVKN